MLLRSSLSRKLPCLFKGNKSCGHKYYHQLLRIHVASASSAEDLFFNLLNESSNVNHLHQTHGFMVPRGLDQKNLILIRFLEACSALNFFDYGYSVLAHHNYKTPQSDIYLYNATIKILSLCPHSAKNAIILYSRARFSGLQPDTYTFPSILNAVVHLSSSDLIRKIHCQAIEIGLDGDDHVAAALIRAYCSCECISDARVVFDGMTFRDATSWNAMVSGYVKAGDAERGRDLFECMPVALRSVISWTTLIAGYARLNKPNEAITMFHRMLLQGFQPDHVTLLVVLSACAHLGDLKLGEGIHNYIDDHRFPKPLRLNNALIDMYAKSGNIEKAKAVFEDMDHKNDVTWTTMIAGLALHGLGREAFEMFSRMERAQIMPNGVTFLALLSACCHSGLVDMGLWFFKNMNSRYGIKPEIKHYGSMIDLLGRAGCLREAQELIQEMPYEANRAIWGSILAASRIHGDLELGEQALQHLIRVEPHNSGNYLLLANVYAERGLWSEARMLRMFMRDTGVKKMPGGSSVEIDNRVHEFNAEDGSHPQSEQIYEVLSQINGQLKLARSMGC